MKNYLVFITTLIAAVLPSVLMAVQANSSVLMVRPLSFGKNLQTAETNVFQAEGVEIAEDEIATKALEEFDAMVSNLRSHEIDVHVYDEMTDASPDSIFPNNWFSLDPHSRDLILYPMLAENRRLERKDDIVRYLREHFAGSTLLDLTHYENEGVYLEGTGSIVFDYVNRIAYACLSQRTDKSLFIDLCERLNYTPISFAAYDQEGTAIYHTNVMMAVGTNICILCTASIANDDERQSVIANLEASGKRVVDISFDQMNHFCGNVLEVVNTSGELFLVMSDQAFSAFESEQLQLLSSEATIIHTDLQTIETIGGGGARCMLGGLWHRGGDDS